MTLPTEVALAHAGKAQVLMREGDAAAARAALTAAKNVAAGLSTREASHIAFFDLVFAGRTALAIAALYTHLTAWPRDAMVLATAANPNGLIGASGRIGQKHQIAAPTQRDGHLQLIARKGRMGWQKASGYNQRAKVEAAIGRYKRVIGDGLRSRTPRRQTIEVAIAVRSLNCMLELGRAGID